MKRRGALFSIIVVIFIGAWVWRGSSRPAEVAVLKPRTADVPQALTVTGRVAGERESELAPETSGIIARVTVREGQSVVAGQPVAMLEDATFRAELAQADAAVNTASSQLAQARAEDRARRSEMTQAEVETIGTVQQAEARLASAEARLTELEAGATPEARVQAAAAVAQARAQRAQAASDLTRAKRLAENDNTARAALERARAEVVRAGAAVKDAEAARELATREMRRLQSLFADGAVARSTVDRAEAADVRAGEALNQARAMARQADIETERQQALLEAAREEAVERAETALVVADRALEAAMARAKEVETPRSELVEQQRAVVREARAALDLARRAGPARVRAATERVDSAHIEVASRRLEEAVRALANDPALVLADEPTGNLDSHSGREVFELMREMNRERGVAFVMATHDERMARAADRVVHIEDGYLHEEPNCCEVDLP